MSISVLKVIDKSAALGLGLSPVLRFSPANDSARGPEYQVPGAPPAKPLKANSGPAFASVHFGDAPRLAARRHQAVWESAHDVGPAVWSILSKAERARRAAIAVAG